MSAPATGPYGAWQSPIAAADVAASGHSVDSGRFVGDDIWWLELRPTDNGRYAVRRRDENGEPIDVLPAPWNARNRVHEYGGGAWTVTADRALIFAEYTDQRLYRLDEGATTPVPLTPEPEVKAGLRYAGLALLRDGEVWCVRERHDPTGAITRDICAVPLDGSAADDGGRITSVVSGSHFLAAPALSPDGEHLAWIAWEHPQMPWDGTELRLGRLGEDGRIAEFVTLLGSRSESLLQPRWRDDDTLFVISDRTGWWNLYSMPAAGGEPSPLTQLDADLGGPAWVFGLEYYTQLDANRLLTVRTLGTDTAAVLDLGDAQLEDIELPGLTSLSLDDVHGSRVLLNCGGGQTASGLRMLDLDTGEIEVIRLSIDEVPDVAYLPEARTVTFPGDDERGVHAVVYPPRNPDFVAPDGELPPYVAFVHGGPTSHVQPAIKLRVAYFTSRGIGVVDVNYGGSTGYGRAYRERLREQWGIVDVEDTVAAVLGLADEGLADRDRLAISGGSAGGWTVLKALTSADTFACGTSYYGVAELVQFHETTHDFESRYDEGLIGPWPDGMDVYVDRAPLSHVDQLSCPVLLLQGLDDPIVTPDQAEMFRDALIAKHIPHGYVAYEGESHGFRRRETIIDSLESELSFYGQVMGFTPPGVPVLELWRG